MRITASPLPRFVSATLKLVFALFLAYSAVGEQSATNTPIELAYRSIYGTNFAISVPNVEPGHYFAVFGFAETEVSAPGQRLFDITYGPQIVASNLDVFSASGRPGKPYFLTVPVDHAADIDAGPIAFRFTARKGLAMFNTLELKNASGATIFVLKATELFGPTDADMMKPPEVPGPILWQDATQPLEARVKDLVSRMSLAEKVAQLRNGAPPIWRLGLPSYDYWSECLHGVGRAGVATVFPQVIGMAATWDVPLIHRVADTIATEARAKHNAYAQLHEGDSVRYVGLTFWTPNINLFRDPRWGRGQETYGEDPWLTSQMGVAFIRGLQGDDPKYVKAMACAKHFAVHSGPESKRHEFDAEPSERDLFDSYLPQFEAAVRQGRVGAVMGAYNRVDGEPACSNPFLLTELLRNKWGFDGHVVSDCGAIDDIYRGHHVVDTAEAAGVRALKAGCDLCCGTNFNDLALAVKEGLLDERQIDTALGRVLTARFRLGLFDPPELVPYAKIPPTENDSPEHAELALRTARESIVLLKNHGVLPLQRENLKRIAVIGTNAISIPVLLGNYNGTPSKPVTILDGMRSVAGEGIEVVYAIGCPLARRKGATNDSNAEAISNAVATAKTADVVVYVGGLSPSLEGEEMRVNYDGFDDGDRTRIELPPPQTELLKALYAIGKPVVFVNCSGSAVAMPWETKNLPAILQAWYPGEAGGRAVAEILFGDVNPAARLPVTFYAATADLPEFENYSMSNRTYRYFKGTPQFAFGHGLSYTRFEYSKARLEVAKIPANGTLKLSFTIKNAGPRDGDEVAQVYFRRKSSAPSDAREALCEFVRVHVAKAKAENVSLEIPLERFRSWNISEKRYVVAPGAYELLLGSASDDIRARLPVTVAN